MNKRVYINRDGFCTFGVLSKIWDNGYIKIAYIKFPFKFNAAIGMGSQCGIAQIDYICCLAEELNHINPPV